MARNGFLSRIGHPAIAGGLSNASKSELRQRVELMESFEQMAIGWFWATDAAGSLVYISASAAESIGLAPEDVVGTELTRYLTVDKSSDLDNVERPLPFLLSARNTFSDLVVQVQSEQTDSERWWAISGKPQFDQSGTFQGYRGSAKDVTARRERDQDASRLARFDTLTGLANRNSMETQLTAKLTAYQASKRSCALMMLDLDRFKQVNDTLGHPAGDELLKQVGQRLTSIIGEKGIIGRLGGDEFLVILPDMDDRGSLGDLSRRIIQMVSQPYSIDGSRAIIGTSIGVAIAPYDGLDAGELATASDLALYAAKGAGKGQFRFYSSDLKDGANLRKQIEEDLRDALQQDQLELHYQPLIDAESHQAACFEALMRWKHPERGWISPAQFIPIAEETSIICDIGEWALQRACRDAAQWPEGTKIAVNVSAVQFGTENFAEIVENALNRSGLEPTRLELEITESVFMADPHTAKQMFKRLKKLGVRLALDDFGTGYSSLGYLRNAPFDKIKIDQSFVRGSTEDGNNNAAIITAIVSLAQALGMQTVAEGVEALDELELVTGKGADLIQGAVFAFALEQDDILSRYEKGDIHFEPQGPANYRSDRKTLFRKIGVIHEDHRYDAVLRNLSRSGAMIEGILDVPVGTEFVLDLGEGQLAVATVRRSEEATQGLEFETRLVSNGSDGLCTRHRVSPYALAAAGMPLAALPPGSYPLIKNMQEDGTPTRPAFMQVDLSHRFD